MGQLWLYYVPCVLQQDGKIGFFAHILELDSPINTPQQVWQLIDRLTDEHVSETPEGKALPVVPLGWTLISAQRGPAVKSPRKRSAPSDNGSGSETATVAEPAGQ